MKEDQIELELKEINKRITYLAIIIVVYILTWIYYLTKAYQYGILTPTGIK